MIHKTKFIYFDFDDTLIEVGSLHAAAFKLTIETTGLELDLNYRSIAGLDTESAFQVLGFDKSESEKLAKIKRKHFSDLAKNSEPIWVEGIPNLLDSLDKEGIRYGVVSSGAGHRIRQTLIDLDSLSRFMFIISREDVKQPKPHPNPFLEAISKSNASIGDSLVVEDSFNGYLSATSAGLDVWQLIVNFGEEIFAVNNGTAKELEKRIIGTC